MTKTTTLREVRDKGKLDEFINGRETEQGAGTALQRTVSSMAEKSSEAPQEEGLKTHGLSAKARCSIIRPR